VTEAVLGRILRDRGQLTLVLDQLDNAFDMKAQGTGPLIDKLISGADKDTVNFINVEAKGKTWEPQPFKLFLPMVLVKIGGLPSAALEDRCITIRMHPATPEEAARLGSYTDAMLARDIGRLMHGQTAKKPEGTVHARALLPSMMKYREEE